MGHQHFSALDANTTDEIQTWADVFQDLDQGDAVETFAVRHVQALDTRADFRGFCSTKIGHLLAHKGGGFLIIHHVHQDGADDIHQKDPFGHMVILWFIFYYGVTKSVLNLCYFSMYAYLNGSI